MFDNLRSHDHGVHIKPNEDADRLAGIAGGIDEIGVQKEVTELFFPDESRRDRRIALRLANAIRPREQIAGASVGDKGFQHPVRLGCPRRYQWQRQADE